jgi:mannose-1-phosphate guanylyltransferase
MSSTLTLGDSCDHRWGVILAGGDGKRLLPLTRKIAGDDRPKQFCAILDSDTLLGQTRRRVERIIKPSQTLLVVTKTHERFYADQVAGTPSSCVLAQPCNRGTAPAILLSLVRLRQLDRRAIVAFFPSDHYFADDADLIAHVDSAFDAARSFEDKVVLLGIAPSSPEVEYGWIEPGAPLTNRISRAVFRVRRFWEKPDLSVASALMKQGCMWNSFVMVGRVDSFLGLIRRTLPSLFAAFESIRPSLFTAKEPVSLLELYSGIRASSFSGDVLVPYPEHLAVLSCGNLGWSDLGEASRVLSVRVKKGVRAEWPLGYAEEQKATA